MRPIGPTIIQRLDGLTLVYLAPDGTWTPERKMAREFGHYDEAKALAATIPHAITTPHAWDNKPEPEPQEPTLPLPPADWLTRWERAHEDP